MYYFLYVNVCYFSYCLQTCDIVALFRLMQTTGIHKLFYDKRLFFFFRMDAKTCQVGTVIFDVSPYTEYLKGPNLLLLFENRQFHSHEHFSIKLCPETVFSRTNSDRVTLFISY